VGDLTLDTRLMRVTRNGVPLALSPQEVRLLVYLVHNAARVVPQQELAEHLHADHFERESNAVEVLVGRVRRKLGAAVIETHRGFGYSIGQPCRQCARSGCACCSLHWSARWPPSRSPEPG